MINLYITIQHFGGIHNSFIKKKLFKKLPIMTNKIIIFASNFLRFVNVSLENQLYYFNFNVLIINIPTIIATVLLNKTSNKT